jgi:hypothetical protein
MYLIEISGDLFQILVLLLSIGILPIYEFLYKNMICPWVQRYEELPENLPGFLNLRNEIQEMAK